MENSKTDESNKVDQLNLDNFYVIGDSHARYFESFKDVMVIRASSAKGLSNKNSTLNTNTQIIEKIKTIDNKSNIIFFFGKVDMDFILNYKYNTDDKYSDLENFPDYITEIVNSYINFIDTNCKDHEIFICELPINHNSDSEILKFIRIGNIHNINAHLHPDDKHEVSSETTNFDKVIPFDTRIKFYFLFNSCLKSECKNKNFKFLEINKYFKKHDGSYEIPRKYYRHYTDHHLNNDMEELYLESLKEFFTN